MSQYICTITPEHSTVVLDLKKLFGITEETTVSVTGNNESDYSEPFNEFLENNLFVNSVNYAKLGSSIKLSVSPYIMTLRINPESKFIDGSFIVSVGDDKIIAYVSKGDAQKIQTADFEANPICSKLNTCMLVRTNPKLSGNIKIVIDSSYHLYLDTFKVSNRLNERVFRKYPISSDGNYPRDVMTVFGKLPKSELFKLPADSLNSHKYHSDYNNQYITKYEYGAETNMDNLYPENMKILAPIHIGKSIPEFFCIFRYNGVYNEESYKAQTFDDMAKFTDMLKSSEVVKIFDLRTYTSIGNYLNNYKDLIYDYLYGSVYLQFIEQDNEKYDSNYRQGNNSWRGIDVSKGIITNKVETSYFGANILDSGSDNVQEAYNNYIINGYERNNVLYPYILNLEFMFNDESSTAENFSMHRYFGLYLSANEFIKYKCIIEDETGKAVKLDENDNVVNDDDILKNIFKSQFSDRIFFMTTNNDAMRVHKNDDVHNFITTYVKNNPDINLCNVDCSEVVWNEKTYSEGLYVSNKNKDVTADVVKNSFLSFYTERPIHYGEHLRFVKLNVTNKDTDALEHICLELVASNDDRLAAMDDFISPYISTNVIKSTNGDTNIYRMSFYTQSIDDNTQFATIEEQFKRINACLYRMNSFIIPESFNANAISFTSIYANDVYFQHIASVNEYDEPEYLEMFMKTESDKKTIYYTDSVKYDELGDSYIKDIQEKIENVRNDFKGPKITLERIQKTENDILHTYKLGQIDNNTVTTYVDYKNPVNHRVDNFLYFNREHKTDMYPLNPDIYTADDKYVAFGLFGYESLGWRFNAIVPFKKMSEFSFPYVVYNNMDDILRTVKHPLVRQQNGHYETVKKINIQTGFVTDNIINAIGIDVPNDIKSVVMNDNGYNTIIHPYNVNGYLVDFRDRPAMSNHQMSLYVPEAAAISIMGIYGIKDLDVSVDNDVAKKIESVNTITIPAGDIINIGMLGENRIQEGTLYRVENGSFNELNLWTFCLMGKTLYYKDNKNASSTTSVNDFGGTLTATTDVVLCALDSNVSQEYSFDDESAVQHIEHFFKAADKQGAVNDMYIPAVPLLNCAWISNGIYFDWNSDLNVNNVKSGKYVTKGYLTEHQNTPVSSFSPNRFNKNSISSYALYDNTVSKFKDIITDRSISNPIRKMLIQNFNIDTAIGYYNSYVQTIEFIYYGIKFIMKFNAEYYSQTIHMNEFNNFEVYIINEYDPLSMNEMYISSDEQIILLVNHKYDISGGMKKVSGVLNADSEFGNNVGYSVYPAPYSIYPDSITSAGSANPGVVLCQKTTKDKIKYDGSDAVYFVQDSNPKKNYVQSMTQPECIYFEYYNKDNEEHKAVVHENGTMLFEDVPEKFAVLSGSQDNFEMGSFRLDTENAFEYTASLYRKQNPFIVREYTSEGSTESAVKITSLSEYIKSFSNDFICNIISNGATQTIINTGTYTPITMTLSVPNKIKYNAGYFIPKMYDIMEFSTNDFEVGNTIGMSMLLANTSVKKINKLKSYTGNKIFSQNKTVERNFFHIPERSLFSSNWDKNYYRHYKGDGEYDYEYINGYLPGIEDKSFFGSKCFVFKDDFIMLDDFTNTVSSNGSKIVDSKFNVYHKNRKQCQLTINVTQGIKTLLQNDETFKKNWNGLETFDIITSMDNYIYNIVMNIFNTQRDAEVHLYTQKSDTVGEIIFSSVSEEDLSLWEEMDDFKTQFAIQNNDMILTITFNMDESVNIHPTVKIFRS